MKVVGYLVFLVALIFYVMTWREIWQLVDETRKLESCTNFNRFWWTPAWRVHRTAYPESRLRRRIVVRFLLTFGVMMIAMACFGYAFIHVSP